MLSDLTLRRIYGELRNYARERQGEEIELIRVNRPGGGGHTISPADAPESPTWGFGNIPTQILEALRGRALQLDELRAEVAPDYPLAVTGALEWLQKNRLVRINAGRYYCPYAPPPELRPGPLTDPVPQAASDR